MEIAAADFDRERDCDQFRDPGEDAMGWEMTASLVVFFALAGLAVIGAVSLILQKHPIHSALSLIMVLNAGVEEQTNISKLAGPPGLLLVVALAGFVTATIVRTTAGVQGSSQTGAMASTSGISNMLFRDFVYPFELTSFLILVAVMGATVLAQREKP